MDWQGGLVVVDVVQKFVGELLTYWHSFEQLTHHQGMVQLGVELEQ